MVENQIEAAAVVSADRATAPRFFNEDATHPLLAPGDRLTNAALASPTPSAFTRGVERELDQAMRSTDPWLDCAGPVG